MGSAKKKFGKQQSKPAATLLAEKNQQCAPCSLSSTNKCELGTENRRTQDVAPTTLNPKQETSCPRGPKLFYVSSFQSRVLRVKILLKDSFKYINCTSNIQ